MDYSVQSRNPDYPGEGARIKIYKEPNGESIIWCLSEACDFNFTMYPDTAEEFALAILVNVKEIRDGIT